MMKYAVWSGAAAVVVLGWGGVRAAPDAKVAIPPPAEMQYRVWEGMRMMDYRMEGFLHTEDKLHPIVLKTLGRQMVYEFQDQPLQIRVQMTEGGSIVERRRSAGEEWQTVGGRERLERILDSDVAYEDLGVDFLRWADTKPLGTDSIKTLPAWAYEARPPVISNYAKAHFWISAEYLAVLRVDAFNAKGQVVKRVEVNGVMQAGQGYVMKEMLVATMIPGRDLSKSRSYIEIRKAEAGRSGLGG